MYAEESKELRMKDANFSITIDEKIETLRDLAGSGPGQANDYHCYYPVVSPSPVRFFEDKEYVDFKFRNPDRQLGTFVAVTIYNEDADFLERTLLGIARNIDYLCSRYEEEAVWKDVVVCILADGKSKMKNCALQYLKRIGLYTEPPLVAHARKDDRQDVSVHLFQSVVELEECKSTGAKHKPIQMMFALKEKNGGKLDSHWWFFSGFCPFFKPDYCILIDVGTIPDSDAFYHMQRCMNREKNVAGVAGEIAPLNSFNISPIVAAQVFEYKISNIMDKTMESVFGYISVLPGAFSAYRYSAVIGEPSKKYFHRMKTELKNKAPFEENMYSTEDRVLSYEIVSRKDCNYTLRYVREAKARTDVPTDVVEFIRQRKRWLNGALFAQFFALLNWNKLLTQSSHSNARKLLFSLEFLYHCVSIGLQWFSVANLYIIFDLLVRDMVANSVMIGILSMLFGFFVGLQLLLGLGNKPHRVRQLYHASIFVFGCFNYAVCGMLIHQLFTAQGKNLLIIGSVVISFGCILLVAFLYGALFEVLASLPQFIFYAGMYNIVFVIYSICNIHDISWGTKNLSDSQLKANGASEAQEVQIREEVETRFEVFRTSFLLLWVLTNLALAQAMTDSDILRAKIHTYLSVVFGIVAFTVAMRTIGSVIFLAQNHMFNCCFDPRDWNYKRIGPEA
eukprot:TRINITY_DN1849_c0_g1_i16.p1 TRINITY_DN1849_c0_g1~~TRINITY_DN1849_c0_g1_i16.p1  ORF type:complete len:677 (-),score=134.14 TRINITY_DN1849_c0_g1_i16:57-2087(-)